MTTRQMVTRAVTDDEDKFALDNYMIDGLLPSDS
jgi:hypothetical protein